jgi:GNAT superfamily N-acetyltransferase
MLLEKRLVLLYTFSISRHGPADRGYMYVVPRKASRRLGKFLHTSQLEDLYVKPEHRNKGVGKALFKELAIIAQDKVTAPTYFLGHDHAIDPIDSRIVLAWIGLFSR